MDFSGPLTTVKWRHAIGKEIDCRAVIVLEEKRNRTLSKIPDGVSVAASIHLKRDPQMHRQLFVMFRRTVDNFPQGFEFEGHQLTFESNEAGYYAFRQWIKRQLNFCNEHYWMEDGVLKKSYEMRSLEYEKCSQKDFEDFYGAARDLMAGIMRINPYEFERLGIES